MASGFFDHGLDEIAKGNVHWVSDSFKVALIRTATYDPVRTTDQNLDDLVPDPRVDTDIALASKAVAGGGECDAADVTFTTVAAGAAIDSLIIYKDTGVASTSTLICEIELAPTVTPSGGNIDVGWGDYIFKI